MTGCSAKKFVYCFIDTKHGLLKIGASDAPLSRLKTIAAALQRPILLSFYYERRKSGAMSEVDLRNLLRDYNQIHPEKAPNIGWTEWYRFPPKGTLAYRVIHTLDACFIAPKPEEGEPGAPLATAVPSAA